jgi:hypothetical protein
MPELFRVAVPRREVPFNRETFPVGTTPPTERTDTAAVAVCPTVSELGVIPRVNVTGCETGGAEVLPPNSIAPIDGRLRRTSPRMSVSRPGMLMPELFAGLAELKLKLKLSRIVSEEMVNGGSPTNLASAQISPVLSVGHPLRNP